MKAKFAGLMLAAGLVLAATAARADDVAANLRLMAFGADAQLTAVKHAIARFNVKYPNVKVDVSIDPITSGWGDYVTHVLSQFNANNAYDVYGTAIETFKTFETRGLFIPLDDFIAKNPGYSDFDPSLFKYSSYQGKTYFIPIGWNNIMINYNRKLFKDAGVDYPKDWTWEQFRDVAKKLTKHDAAGNVTQYGYEVPNQNFFVQPWFFTNGTSVLNADWTASNMLDPKVAETLQFLHDLIHIDKVSPIPGKDPMDNQFAAGQVAMISRGHWIIENAKRANLDMDVADVPSKVNDDTVIGFGGYAVSSRMEDPSQPQISPPSRRITVALRNTASVALSNLFPALERTLRETEFNYNQLPNGGLTFRQRLPLGSGFDIIGPCADGHFGAIVRPRSITRWARRSAITAATAACMFSRPPAISARCTSPPRTWIGRPNSAAISRSPRTGMASSTSTIISEVNGSTV